MQGYKIIKVPTLIDARGSLSFVEYQQVLDFVVKRVYWLYDLKLARGAHAHKKLKQFIICINGRIDFELDNGINKDIVTLDSPDYGLYIDSPLWRDIKNFHNNPKIIILASEIYMEEDYIRSYEEFVKWKFHS